MSRLGEYVPVSELEYPVIMNIPICHQRAGNFMLNLPIAVGDTGMIVVAQRDLDNWKANGGIQPTKTLRQFNFNDGIYLPFVPNNTNKVTNYNATMLEVRAGSEYIQMDGLGNVNVYATKVKLGKAAFEYIVKATKLKTWITNQINSVFNGHTHPAPSVVAVANSINALAPVGSVPAPNQKMSSPSESDLASISHQVGD
jgi:hypothetical protein